MITPRFELKQTDDVVILVIRAPYVKLSADSEPEVHVDQCVVTFYALPYYLRLTLPGEVLFDDSVMPEFDVKTGCFTIHLPKAVKGEPFPDLDMLTKLLAPPGATHAKRPLIEVLDDGKEEAENGEEEDDLDFFVEQQPYIEDDVLTLSGPKYGFANQRSGVLKKLQSELWEVIDLKDADTTAERARRQLRTEDEEQHFSDEHYLADLHEDEGIRCLMEFEPEWSRQRQQIEKGSSPESVVKLTADQNETLLKLPRKKHLLNSKEMSSALMGLVDIIFGYAYNYRTTEGENTVSSGWTVCKLSSTLSWFDTFYNLKDVLRASFQRSLCYPLHRNWQLSQKVFSDVKDIFAVGRRCLLKCLLDTHQLLIDADQHYILNDLYITDYCVWIQNVSDSLFKNFSKALNQVTMEKSDVNLDLTVIEKAGELAIAEADNPKDQSSSDDSTDDSSEEESRSSEEESDSSEEESDSSEEESDKESDKENILEKLKTIHISETLEKNESLEKDES